MGRKIKICKDKGCDNEETTAGYCRYHYLRNWKEIKREERKHAVKSLNRYIEHICTKYPDQYVAAVKRDLASPDFFSRQADNFLGEEGDALMQELTGGAGIAKLISQLKVDRDY